MTSGSSFLALSFDLSLEGKKMMQEVLSFKYLFSQLVTHATVILSLTLSVWNPYFDAQCLTAFMALSCSKYHYYLAPLQFLSLSLSDSVKKS